MQTRSQAAELKNQIRYFPDPKYGAEFFENYAENMQKRIDEVNSTKPYSKIIKEGDQIKLRSEEGVDISQQAQNATLKLEDMANTNMAFHESSKVLENYANITGIAMFNMFKVLMSIVIMANNDTTTGFVKNKLLHDGLEDVVSQLGDILLEVNYERSIAFTKNELFWKAYQSLITSCWEIDHNILTDEMMQATLNAEIQKQKLREKEEGSDDVDMMDDESSNNFKKPKNQ